MAARKSPPAPRRSVRFTDAHWRLIEAVAAEKETYPSTFVRRAALEVARRELAEAVAAEKETYPSTFVRLAASEVARHELAQSPER
jgi:uncharacterized protein Veg